MSRVILVVVAVLAACGGSAPPPAQPAPIEHHLVAPRPAPIAPPVACDDCMPAVALVARDGTTYSASSLAGKVVIVSFWATWVHPSAIEIPRLGAFYGKYAARGVVVLGLVVDDTADDDALDAYARAHGLTYPIVRSTPEILTAFRYPDALPTTFIYDRHGQLVHHKVGVLGDDDLAQVAALL